MPQTRLISASHTSWAAPISPMSLSLRKKTGLSLYLSWRHLDQAAIAFFQFPALIAVAVDEKHHVKGSIVLLTHYPVELIVNNHQQKRAVCTEPKPIQTFTLAHLWYVPLILRLSEHTPPPFYSATDELYFNLSLLIYQEDNPAQSQWWSNMCNTPIV